MNEEELVKRAARAVGEPVGDTEADAPDFEHAVAVLRGATVAPDTHRGEELEEAVADQARMVHLWHFAAVAVVSFCIGMVALISIGLTPSDDLIPVAKQNAAVGNDHGSVAPANNEPDTQVYERPNWIREQAAEVANLPAAPPPGSEIGSGGNFGRGGENSGGSGDFTVLYPIVAPEGLVLVGSTLVPASRTGAKFAMQRIKYAAPGHALVLLEAAETTESRKALDADGLPGNVVTVVRSGTVVLLISNTINDTTLRQIASKLAEKP